MFQLELEAAPPRFHNGGVCESVVRRAAPDSTKVNPSHQKKRTKNLCSHAGGTLKGLLRQIETVCSHHQKGAPLLTAPE